MRANRRETIMWIGASAFIVVTLAVIAMLGMFATPVRPSIAIGTVDDFPHGAPPRLITVGNQQVFIVVMATEILAFDPQVKVGSDFRCPVKWVRLSNRFEDPCGGSKFFMYGCWIEGPAQRDLDRFPVTIDPDGTVRIETWRTIKGEPHPCANPRWATCKKASISGS